MRPLPCQETHRDQDQMNSLRNNLQALSPEETHLAQYWCLLQLRVSPNVCLSISAMADCGRRLQGRDHVEQLELHVFGG
jgi:hypothetical protein